MRTNYNYWPTSSQSHSTEVEHRLTSAEIRIDAHEDLHEAHDKRISTLEKTLRAIIWALTAIASSKSGDLVDIATALLKAAKP